MALAYFYVKDYGEYFYSRRATLARSEVRAAGGGPLFEKSWLTLRNSEGFTVECGMLVPRRDDRGTGTQRRYPAIILMGGKATGKHAVDYTLDIQDVIIVAPDYAYEPRESYNVTQFLADVPAARLALLDMVPAVMLVTDYLFHRPDVDSTRLVLLGYSFGAPFVPCIIAHDRRAAVAAMVYGGAGLPSLIRHNVRRFEGPAFSELVAQIGGILLRPLEPLRYVEQIAPIPLILINGIHDEQIPRENVEMLYSRAREPKKIIWLESAHVNQRNVDLTRLIVKTLKSELTELQILGETNSP
jgi:dienelactone hydrolase